MIELDVFIEGLGEPIGRLTGGDDDATTFQYLRDDLPYPVSISLPVKEEPFDDLQARPFFSNLLFENRMREQIMAQHGISPQDYVGLLAYLGADCPGAISCVPRGSGPGKVPGDMSSDYSVMSQEDLKHLIRSLARYQRLPVQIKDPSPLAGVQSKIAVTRMPDGRFALPKEGSKAPTTHILKVPSIIDQSQAHQENTLMSLMSRLTSHPVAKTEILESDGLFGLLVTRFDRSVTGGKINRLHQEDFCQALGISEQLKYERYGRGERKFCATSIAPIINSLARPGAARLAFFEVTIAGLALGNTDAHAKNHAILHSADGAELAPVYDVLPTVLHDVRHDMAFRIGNAIMAEDITPHDISIFLNSIGLRRATAPVLARGRAVIERLIAILEDPTEKLPKRIFDAAAQQVKWMAPSFGIESRTPEFDLVPINRVENWD